MVMQSSHFGDGKHRPRPSWLNRARPGVRAAADGRLPSPRRYLHRTRFVSALVRGGAALLRRSGAGRAVEWPWQLDSHVRVSRPNGRSCRAHARTPQATRQHAGISRAIRRPGPVPSPHGVLQAAMNDMRPVGRGRLEGSSGQPVTKIVDRCRDAVTAPPHDGTARCWDLSIR
jgi:hypothetical protein